jgi:hypothetical protein
MRLILLLALFSCPSWAAIARVASPASAICYKSTNDASPLPCNATNPPVVGDTLIVAVIEAGSLGPMQITDNATGGTNTYTRQVVGATSSGAQVSEWSAPILRTTAGTFTITVALTSSIGTITVWVAGEYSGLPSPPVADITTSSTTSASGVGHCSVSTAFVTTTNATDLVIGVAAYNGAVLTTSTSGFIMHSLTGGAFGKSGSLDNITAATLSALDVTVNGTAGQAWSGCAIVAYKAVSLAVTPTRHRLIIR